MAGPLNQGRGGHLGIASSFRWRNGGAEWDGSARVLSRLARRELRCSGSGPWHLLPMAGFGVTERVAWDARRSGSRTAMFTVLAGMQRMDVPGAEF